MRGAPQKHVCGRHAWGGKAGQPAGTWHSEDHHSPAPRLLAPSEPPNSLAVPSGSVRLGGTYSVSCPSTEAAADGLQEGTG